MRTYRKLDGFKQNGYTLIELIVVIVIVGILSTMSIQTYANLTAESRQAATQGVAGALSSASAANFTLRSAQLSSATTIAVSDCTHVASLLTAGSMASFTIASQPVAAGATATCTVDHVTPGPGTAATFIAHGVS